MTAEPTDLQAPAPPRGGATWTEVAVVLTLGVMPDLVYAIQRVTTHGAGGWGHGGIAGAAVYLLVRSLQVSLPLLYILYLARAPLSDFGVSRLRGRDLGWGMVIWIGGMVAWYAAWSAMRSAMPGDWIVSITGRSNGAAANPALEAPDGWAAWGALLVMSAANGFAEELVVRAYLMTRLRQLTRGWAVPLLASTLVFAAYHVYQGAAGVINGMIIGLVYGVAFIRLRRFWPLAVAHALADVAGWVVISAQEHG